MRLFKGLGRPLCRIDSRLVKKCVTNLIELLEASDGERVDTRAPGTAGAVNPGASATRSPSDTRNGRSLARPRFAKGGDARHFNPYRPTLPRPPGGDVDQAPTLDAGERWLVLLFLRRYVRWCARARRYAQAGGAARLWRTLD